MSGILLLVSGIGTDVIRWFVRDTVTARLRVGFGGSDRNRGVVLTGGLLRGPPRRFAFPLPSVRATSPAIPQNLPLLQIVEKVAAVRAVHASVSASSFRCW